MALQTRRLFHSEFIALTQGYGNVCECLTRSEERSASAIARHRPYSHGGPSASADFAPRSSAACTRESARAFFQSQRPSRIEVRQVYLPRKSVAVRQAQRLRRWSKRFEVNRSTAGYLFDGPESSEEQKACSPERNLVWDQSQACKLVPKAASFRDREGGPSVLM